MRERGDKDKRHSKKNLPWILLIILAVVVLANVVVFSFVRQKNKGDSALSSGTTAVTSQDSDGEDGASERKKGFEDFVIFGVDSRSGQLGEGTRSDSIMIVHVNHDDSTVRVASIYRDCMVQIDGHGYEKITHAHSYGGPELAVSTVNENFDLNIEHYVTMNFISVADLVDEIGGVSIDINNEEVSHLSSYDGTYSGVISEAGTYTLDGAQALAYSRIRYASGGDYRRSERQRTILFEVFNKAKSMSADERISLAEDMLDEVNTNFRNQEISELLYDMSKYEIEEMTAYPQVFYGGSVDGAWVEVPITLIDMNEGLHAFLYGQENYVPSESVEERSEVLSGKVSGPNEDLRE